MKTKKNLKLAVVLFAMIFTVGAAFAANKGMLAFGGTVSISSAGTIDEARLEFTRARVDIGAFMRHHIPPCMCPPDLETPDPYCIQCYPHPTPHDYFVGNAQIIEESGRQKIVYDINILNINAFPHFALFGTIDGINIYFDFYNAGTVPVKITGFDHNYSGLPFGIKLNGFLNQIEEWPSTDWDSVAWRFFSTDGFPDWFDLHEQPESIRPLVIMPGETMRGEVWFAIETLKNIAGTQNDYSFNSWFALIYEHAQ